MAISLSMLNRAGVCRSLCMMACASAAHWLRACAERSAQRHALARLDDDRLRDVGLTRADARAEAAKAFWCR